EVPLASAALAARVLLALQVSVLVGCASSTAPRFAMDGPNAEEYGARDGYPVRVIYRLPFFVGLFSHYDQIFEARMVPRSSNPSRLSRATSEPALRYEFEARTFTIDDYLARNPVTGLLIMRADTILVERYQYARHDRHRFASFSMVKTVTAMLIGI